jgi:proton-coupled amino acid transporter
MFDLTEPINIIWFGLFCFVVTAPLSFVRRIEKFAFIYVFADILIFVTTITIIAYASKNVHDHGWGNDVEMFNKATWLSMIGSAVYAYEGIGVVIPLLDVTEKPEVFPKILLCVLCTVFGLYTFFGEFCYFVYGSSLTNPLITANLPQGWLVWIVKIFFCINLVITCPL